MTLYAPIQFSIVMNSSEVFQALMSDPRTWISVISLGFSFFSLIISFLSFWRARPALQLRRDQQAQMAVVASRATVLWDQLQTVTHSITNNYKADNYLLPSMKANARRLDESIDKAIGLGLYTSLVGNDSGSVTMHTAFVQSLCHTFADATGDLEVWTKQHLLMGMIRLLNSCRIYYKCSDNDLNNLGVILPSFQPQTIEISRSYLHASSGDT